MTTLPEKDTTIENILDEFRNEIYGEDDALFDRAGNNVSNQVEKWLTQTLQAERQRCEEMVEEARKEEKKYLRSVLKEKGYTTDFIDAAITD